LTDSTRNTFGMTDQEDDQKNELPDETKPTGAFFEKSLSDLIQQRNAKPIASTPSTLGGVPIRESDGMKIITPSQPLNSMKNPVDDQGFTLYTDEKTGEKKRVFEALVDYPCEFKIKIIGANEGSFEEDMIALVAEFCSVDVEKLSHSSRKNGKWISVTIDAPVTDGEMLYALYELINREPRVKFKF